MAKLQHATQSVQMLAGGTSDGTVWTEGLGPKATKEEILKAFDMHIAKVDENALDNLIDDMKKAQSLRPCLTPLPLGPTCYPFRGLCLIAKFALDGSHGIRPVIHFISQARDELNAAKAR